MASTISFPNMFDISSGKVSVVSGEMSYRQSFKSALLTNVGELLGDPSFGSNMKELLFELKSTFLQHLIKESIAETAAKYVPEISVEDTIFSIDDQTGTQVQIVINYYTINTGETNFIELTVLPNGTLTTR